MQNHKLQEVQKEKQPNGPILDLDSSGVPYQGCH